MPPSYAAEDIVLGSHNARAFNALMAWPQWPQPVAIVVGEAGAGKTHLAQIWARHAGAICIPDDMPTQDVIAIASTHAIVLDNSPLLHDEAAAFAILNVAMTHKHGLLITTHAHPELWHIVKNDIRSRLRLASVLHLYAPDEEALYGLMYKLFADLQLHVEPSVVRYVVARLPRQFLAVQQFVEYADAAALAQKKPVTRTLAAQIMLQYFPDHIETDQYQLFLECHPERSEGSSADRAPFQGDPSAMPQDDT